MHSTGIRTYEDAYNVAGILAHDVPPSSVTTQAASADVIAVSHMARAIESARRLAPDREPLVSPLLCELAIDPPALPLRLPIEVWDALSFAQWTYRLWRKVDRDETRRARDAAGWLENHAAGGRTVLAITHGGFRRILDAELLRRRWMRSTGRRGHENWSNWSYARDH
jgi:hypothetical protein